MQSLLNKMNVKSTKEFFNKLLNGVAIGIVVGLIPNAILGEIFKAFAKDVPMFGTLNQIVILAQFTVPILIGCLVANQFQMNAIETATLGATIFVSSGAAKFVEGKFMLVGIGDLINIIIMSTITVIVLFMLRGKLGSLTMILTPVLVITFVGGFGLYILPYVKMISTALGDVIRNFTQLQPLIMSILLSVSFAIIIISPMSTVAIAIAVGLEGLASGAANVGIATCAMTLVVGSMRVNKLGVTLAVFLGSMKLFIPQWLKNPIMNIPIILNGIVGGIIAFVFNIQGTPQSAGFGFSGLVGPINAFKFMENGSTGMKIGILFLAYFVITFVSAYAIDYILVNVVKLYKREIFVFEEK